MLRITALIAGMYLLAYRLDAKDLREREARAARMALAVIDRVRAR